MPMIRHRQRFSLTVVRSLFSRVSRGSRRGGFRSPGGFAAAVPASTAAPGFDALESRAP